MPMRFQAIDYPFRLLFLLHIAGGAIALIALFFPLFSKKGGVLHVKTGWIYSIAMLIVGVSALLITPWRIFFDPARTQETQSFAVFLFYISIFSISALWFGFKCLRNKKRTTCTLSASLLGPPIAVILMSLIIQIIGLVLKNKLFIAFPFLGLSLASIHIRYWISKPRSRWHWWYAHMSGMITACISTITAFFVTAIPRLLQGDIARSPILWMTPGLIMGTVLVFWTRHYRIQFGDK